MELDQAYGAKVNQDRELENHEVRISRMETDIEALAASIEKLTTTMLLLNNTLEQGKGGWKVMLAVGTIVGFVASLFAKAFGEWIR